MSIGGVWTQELSIQNQNDGVWTEGAGLAFIMRGGFSKWVASI